MSTPGLVRAFTVLMGESDGEDHPARLFGRDIDAAVSRAARGWSCDPAR